MYDYTYSVIIPHYTKSGTDLLARLINSIPERDDIQVLVVDNSPIRIDPNLFSERKSVVILFSDSTKGAGHARNIGIENASGKWMIFSDADDFFTDVAFTAFDKYWDSDNDVIFFKMISCFSDSYEPARRHEEFVKIIDKYFEDGIEYNLRYHYVVPWCKMLRSSVVLQNNLRYDEVKVANDVIFGLLLGLSAGKIDCDSASVSCITVNKGSLTNTESYSNVETRFDVAIRKNKIMKAHRLKKSSSVMIHIVQSVHYGFRPFCHLVKKAIVAGDLFVGWQNWFKTVFKMMFRNDNKMEYIVKEK